MPSLGTMRVFVRSKAAIIEAVGVFGGYSETGPFFNVQTDSLDMHIFPAEITSIYAVEKLVDMIASTSRTRFPVFRPARRRRDSRRFSGRITPRSLPLTSPAFIELAARLGLRPEDVAALRAFMGPDCSTQHLTCGRGS